jgi:hypothetical protein
MPNSSREGTLSNSADVRFIRALDTIGSSLAGSGMLTSLAVACVVFGTGMSPNRDGTTNGRADATRPAHDEPPGLPVGESVRLTGNALPRSLDPRTVATASGRF